MRLEGSRLMWGGLRPCTGPQVLFCCALPGNMKPDQQIHPLAGMILGYSISGSLCLKRKVAEPATLKSRCPGWEPRRTYTFPLLCCWSIPENGCDESVSLCSWGRM